MESKNKHHIGKVIFPEGGKVRSSKEPMCKINGHQWEKTVSDKVQVCSRKDCKQMQQLIQGHWHFVGRKSGKQGMTHFLEQAKLRDQIAMWEEEEKNT
jgi:hypothetical protein